MYGIRRAWAALATAFSPSGWKMVCTPTGAMAIGEAYSVPKSLVDKEGKSAGLSRLGMMDQRRNAARFLSSVSRVPAEPWT